MKKYLPFIIAFTIISSLYLTAQTAINPYAGPAQPQYQPISTGSGGANVAAGTNGIVATTNGNVVTISNTNITQSATNAILDHSLVLTNDDGTPIFLASASGVTNATLKNATSVATDANGKYIAGAGSTPTIPFNLSTNGDGAVVQRGMSLSNSAAAISGGAQAYGPQYESWGHSSDNAGTSQPVMWGWHIKTIDRTGSGIALTRMEFVSTVPGGGVAEDTFYLGSDDSWSFNQLSSSSGGALTVNNTINATHFIGGTVAPTVVTNAGAGGGTGTVTLDANANDAAMYITLLTGSAPATSSTIFTVTFHTAYGVAPHVVFCPANATDAILSGATSVFLDTVGTGTFTFKSGSTALAAGTTYKWSVIVLQ